MGSSWRRLAEMLGSSAGTTGSWARRFAEGVGSIGGVDITLGDKGSWARRIAEGAATPLAPDVGSWARRLGGDGPSGSWAKRLAEGSDEISALGGGAPFSPDGLANLAAWFRFNTGLTDAGGGACSQWADASGNGRHLKQVSGILQPLIQVDGSILFDGVNDYLKCDAFTLNQPFTIYAAMKQVTWTSSDRIIDGNAADSILIWQTGVAPAIVIFAGNSVASNTNLAVDTYAAVCGVFNGATSSLRVDNTTKTTGDAGANNAAGFTLGGRGAGGNTANIEVREVIIYTGAHDDATQALVVAYLQDFF